MSISDKLKKAAAITADVIAPNRCPCCGKFIKWDALLCSGCESVLEPMNGSIAEIPEGCICAEAALWYKGKARQGIYTLKEGFGKNYAVYAASLLKERLDGGADLITCVPSRLKRGSLSVRGHAETFARELSKALGIPCDTGVLVRKKTKIKQHELTAAERAGFAKGLYYLRDKNYRLDGKRILLADDVLTTGATMSVCAKLLLGCGAESVTAVTICRTPLEKEGNV